MQTLKKIETEAAKLSRQEKLELIDVLVHDLKKSERKERVSLRGMLKGTKITDKDLKDAKGIWE